MGLERYKNISSIKKTHTHTERTSALVNPPAWRLISSRAAVVRQGGLEQDSVNGILSCV